eukprot:10376656-Alexandrium_andersonii.AAC.1
MLAAMGLQTLLLALVLAPAGSDLVQRGSQWQTRQSREMQGEHKCALGDGHTESSGRQEWQR